MMTASLLMILVEMEELNGQRTGVGASPRSTGLANGLNHGGWPPIGRWLVG